LVWQSVPFYKDVNPKKAIVFAALKCGIMNVFGLGQGKDAKLKL
jgi:hypothetical protein